MNEAEFRTGKGPSFAPDFDYIAEAMVTLSPSWHGDMVSRAQFLGAINGAIDAANKLDKIKKTLFYGRDNNLIAPGERAIGDVFENVGCGSEHGINIIHAIIGSFTEAGELLEALRKDYNSGDFDPINLREETGDQFWYLAILARSCAFTFEQAQRINIEKLRARFPDKFTEFDANNRNLSTERAILEDVPDYGDNGEGGVYDPRPIVGNHICNNEHEPDKVPSQEAIENLLAGNKNNS